MTFPLDLIRRVLLLVGLILLALPLMSLGEILGLDVTLSATQILEVIVLVFVAVTGVVGIFDSRLFVASRLFRPALVLGGAVLALGVCDVLFQFARLDEAVREVVAAASTYFVDPASADLLQPTLAGLEFAALLPLVEIFMRRRRRAARASAWVIAAAAVAILVWSRPYRLLPISTPLGELVELRVLALVAFGWSLWVAFTAPLVHAGDRHVRWGLLAAVFWLLLANLLGTSASTFAIATAIAAAVGLAAAVSPAPSSPAGTGSSRWVFWALGACVLVSAPLRVWTVLHPVSAEVIGAGPLQPPLEDVHYRVADQTSTWSLPPQTRAANVLMRWDPAAPSNCHVRIKVAGRADDAVSMFGDRWTLVRFAVPPAQNPRDPLSVTFEVVGSSCRLFVGPITATR